MAALGLLLRIIREEEPPRPSRHLSSSESLPSIAANRQIEPKKLSGLVRGELDWIVMKALEKDRNRRYETANGLRGRRAALPGGRTRRSLSAVGRVSLPKFARRNKTALAFVGMLALTLLIGVGIATWQAIRPRGPSISAKRHEQLAVEQQRLAQTRRNGKRRCGLKQKSNGNGQRPTGKGRKRICG